MATPTRERLLDEAERLFARHGVDRVTSRQIVVAAGQRNVSAVTYHFGSCEGLVSEILTRHGGPVDAARGDRRAKLGADPRVQDLVACLVGPYVALLGAPSGRSYLRIVDRLRGRFAAWRIESDVATTVHLADILDEIERRAPGEQARRRERVVGMIMVMTGLVAERARRIDDDIPTETTEGEFIADLIAMCTAVVIG